MKCDWCQSTKDVGYTGNKKGKIFQCKECLDSELNKIEAERLKRCPVENDLIERGYGKLKRHQIMPCSHKEGEFYDSDLSFEDSSANLFLVFDNKGNEIDFFTLEYAFEYCMKSEGLKFNEKRK